MMLRPLTRSLTASLVLMTAVPAWAADTHTISMSGHGEAKAAPDLVTINAGVTTSAPTAAAALAANTARMKQVFAVLEKMGVPQKNIQTTNFSVAPQYNNTPGNESPRLTGYQVANQLALRLADVGGLGKTLDTLVAAGANNMNGIDFAIQNPAPLLEKARADAIADARLRAETYARAAGVALGPILSISEGSEGPRPMYRLMVMAAPPPVPVAAGEETVSANVTVTWEIH
ncbi:MAG: SIMPL domain-containing protein [Alphaproteobacteria bacterium]|nr:SIMPL domain-containing protein [Alphaproteobacteria bacterium]